MDKIEIETRKTCSVCKGSGKVMPKIWDDFWQRQDINTVKTLKENDFPKCNDEETCPECKGNGIIFKWISMLELNELLK